MSAASPVDNAPVKTTPLRALHLEKGARMAAFAGYDMPIQYPLGIMKEHQHTRTAAGLFDVSHMGQILLRPRGGDTREVMLALETLVPVDVLGIGNGRQRYAMFTNAEGGILDDLMIANLGDHLMLIVNASRKDEDEVLLRSALSGVCEIVRRDDMALIAVQGPGAEAAVAKLCPDAKAMAFMDVRALNIAGIACLASRSGYTGEDGFEISVPAAKAEQLTRTLLDDPSVALIGLGARDSLRLEAGLCLYGSDLDETTSPVEADLKWAIQKARRAGGARAGGFGGATRILAELQDGPKRLRVGLKPQGRTPVRGGAALFADSASQVGVVTSGGFGPTAEAPVAMGYVPTASAKPGQAFQADVRGNRVPVEVAAMPFVPHRYRR